MQKSTVKSVLSSQRMNLSWIVQLLQYEPEVQVLLMRETFNYHMKLQFTWHLPNPAPPLQLRLVEVLLDCTILENEQVYEHGRRQNWENRWFCREHLIINAIVDIFSGSCHNISSHICLEFSAIYIIYAYLQLFTNIYIAFFVYKNPLRPTSDKVERMSS